MNDNVVLLRYFRRYSLLKDRFRCLVSDETMITKLYKLPAPNHHESLMQLFAVDSASLHNVENILRV